MKKVLRWLGGGLLLLLVLGIAAWFVKDSILKSFTERRLRQETGLIIEIGQFKTDLTGSSLRLKDLRVLNPLGFGSAAFVDIPEGFCVLELRRAKTNEVHFKELKIHLAELNLIKNKQGLLNLESVKESILQALAHRKRSLFNFGFGGIDRLELTLDKVNYTDQQQPENTAQIDLGVQNEVATNLQTEEQFSAWLNAFLVRVAIQQYMQPKSQGLNFLWKSMLPGQGEQH